jgi:hypothetical protein
MLCVMLLCRAMPCRAVSCCAGQWSTDEASCYSTYKLFLCGTHGVFGGVRMRWNAAYDKVGWVLRKRKWLSMRVYVSACWLVNKVRLRCLKHVFWRWLVTGGYLPPLGKALQVFVDSGLACLPNEPVGNQLMCHFMGVVSYI